jgi:hypothetical protein
VASLTLILLLSFLIFVIASAEFIPRPFCDSDSDSDSGSEFESCGWSYTPCPINGECANGVFQRCINDAEQVNGTGTFFCVLPGTDDAQAWEITPDVRLTLKQLPVLLSIERLAEQIEASPVILARAVNFTGLHKVDSSGEIFRTESSWAVIMQLGVILLVLCLQWPLPPHYVSGRG